MKIFLLSLSLTLSALSARSETISGKVIQSDHKTAGYATVTLHQAKDSSLVKGTLANEDGQYVFTGVHPGQYYLEARLIGSGATNSRVFDYSGGDLTVDALVLAEQSRQLGEVTITARKPTIEVKADKTVLNVEGTINSTGLNALELLRKAPGVTVDNNENVSVKGKNGVKITIDGRDVPLDGQNLAATLKGMQASDIEKIEIISNPSAKYDAAGNAGIINIKLRKNKALGTNGNAGLEGIYGESPKGGLNLGLNHRSEKWSLYGAYNNHYGDWHNEQYFLREQNGLSFDQAAKSKYTSRWNSARIGADYTVNSRHTLGVLLNGSRNNSDWEANSRTAIGRLESPGAADSLLLAGNHIDNERADINLNLNYRFADTSGHSLNIDLDRGLYDLNANSLQPNYYTLPDGTPLRTKVYRSLTPTDITITTAKADYEQRLFKGIFSAGFKIADVSTDNTFNFYNVDDGLETLDPSVSNRFDYHEQTNAAYLNFQREFGKLHVQAGVRAENTVYKGNLTAATPQNGTAVEDNYIEFFPSAALTYKVNEKIGMNLTYSRRIDRPSYEDLNPFEFKLDELTYQKGNPLLRPQFTQSFELSPSYKGQPFLTLGYSHTTDLFTQVIDTTDLRASFITQENIADQHNYSVSINAPTHVTKWWDGLVSVTGRRSAFSATFREGFSAESTFNALNVYAEQNFRLPKGFSVSISGWYNSRAFWGTLRSNPQGAMEVGIQKKILHDKGQLRLRVGDVLNTAGWGGENVFTPGLRMSAHGNWESQTVTLNFYYRFGSAEVKEARQRNTGLEDEKRRVKSGRG